jgi:hypothetical protein
MAARDDTISSAQVRHEQAVARTLNWSDQAAEDGDAANALTWLQALEAIGDPLPNDYQKKRQAWRRALRLDRKHRERRARPRHSGAPRSRQVRHPLGTVRSVVQPTLQAPLTQHSLPRSLRSRTRRRCS